MGKNKAFDRFLSDDGKIIFERIMKHCKDMKLMDADVLEAAMLANSLDIYSVNAEFCKENGFTQSPTEGGWDQVRPEYTVMKNEYQNILKHSAKFGLNPGDRSKFFKGLESKEKKGFNLDKPMRIAQ